MSAIKPVKIVAELTLPHKKFCHLDFTEGAYPPECACLYSDYEAGSGCNMGHFEHPTYSYLNVNTGAVASGRDAMPGCGWLRGILRPQSCISAHGEGVEA